MRKELFHTNANVTPIYAVKVDRKGTFTRLLAVLYELVSSFFRVQPSSLIGHTRRAAFLRDEGSHTITQVSLAVKGLHCHPSSSDRSRLREGFVEMKVPNAVRDTLGTLDEADIDFSMFPSAKQTDLRLPFRALTRSMYITLFRGLVKCH